jgi:hypothetical protein
MGNLVQVKLEGGRAEESKIGIVFRSRKNLLPDPCTMCAKERCNAPQCFERDRYNARCGKDAMLDRYGRSKFYLK